MEELELIETHLLPLKHALTDSVEFKVHGRWETGPSPSGMDPHYELIQYLEYIRSRMLPICDSARRYEFLIHFKKDEIGVVTNTITSLLQMPEVKRCSTISINIFAPQPRYPMQLPIDEISSWLEKSADKEKINVQNKHRRYMHIDLWNVCQNAHEMIDHFKTVFFEIKL